MIVKHFVLKKCIENSIGDKKHCCKDVKGTVFPILLLPKVTLEKRTQIYRMSTNQVLQCFSKKCPKENPYLVLLTCAMVANSEYYYFAMFSP